MFDFSWVRVLPSLIDLWCRMLTIILFMCMDSSFISLNASLTSISYRRGCSGDFQISVSDNPFERRPKPQIFFVNLTTPRDITGLGGTGEFQLIWTCKKNFCSCMSLPSPHHLLIWCLSLMSSLLHHSFL